LKDGESSLFHLAVPAHVIKQGLINKHCNVVYAFVELEQYVNRAQPGEMMSLYLILVHVLTINLFALLISVY
jgi:hypothetical protein